VHQTETAGFLGAEAFTGEGIAAHLAQPHRLAKLRQDDSRHQAPTCFADGKDRVS
jgi:hypothetical protein